MDKSWQDIKTMVDTQANQIGEGCTDAEGALLCSLVALKSTLIKVKGRGRYLINDVFGIQVESIYEKTSKADEIDLAAIPNVLSENVKDRYRQLITFWNSKVKPREVPSNYRNNEAYADNFCYLISMAIMNSLWCFMSDSVEKEGLGEVISGIPTEWRAQYAFLVYDYTPSDILDDFASILPDGDIEHLNTGVVFAYIMYEYITSELDNDGDNKAVEATADVAEEEPTSNEVGEEIIRELDFVEDFSDNDGDNEAVEETEDIAEEEPTSSEVDEEIVNVTIDSIMSKYDRLYQPFFEIEPVGVLTKTGILEKPNGSELSLRSKGKSYSIALYDCISSGINAPDYDMEMSYSFLNEDGTLKYNYCPSLQIRNVFGMCGTKASEKVTYSRQRDWNAFRDYLLEDVTTRVTEILSKCDESVINTASRSLIQLFTTCIVVDKFDGTKAVAITMLASPVADSIGYKTAVIQYHNSKPMGKDANSIQLIYNDTDNIGIHKALLVMNATRYNKEILFSYKAMQEILEGGGQIDGKRTLIGRTIGGKNKTYNFESPAAVVSLVIAGSGSGKGVVTLNMLSTFLAEAYPTVYVDWKPDMAGMLWDLERKTSGSRILATDHLAGISSTGQRPVRDYETGYNMPYIEDFGELNVLPYIKVMHLMAVCALARQIGYSGMSSRGKKMMFILDEAQAMNKDFSTMKLRAEELKKKLEPKTVKGIRGEESEEYKYICKLYDVFDSLHNAMVEFRNTTGRVGNVGCVILGQQSDATAWSQGAMKRDTLGFLVGNCTMKMLGKGAVDGTKYSLSGAYDKLSGRELLGEMGYFALVDGNMASSGNTEVVKSYLVLNENDIDEGGVYTSGLLSNIDDATTRNLIMEDLRLPNGEANELAGFAGILKYMGERTAGFDAASALSNGYVELEKLLTALGILGSGRYKDVEGYLFDCSLESLFSYKDLTKAVKNGLTIYQVLNGEGADDPLYAKNTGEEEPNEEGTPPMPNAVRQPMVISHTRHESPNEKSAFSEATTPELELKDSVFDTYPPDHEWSTLERMDALNETSRDLVELIANQFGGKNRVTRFVVTARGGLVINNVKFQPKLSESRLAAMPLDIKQGLAMGDWSDMFKFYDLKKFPNLKMLSIESDELAEFRAAHELGLWDNDWRKLFKRFKHLRVIEIGSARYTLDGENERGTSGRRKKALDTQDTIRRGFGFPSIMPSAMSRFYQNKKIPVGVKVVGTVLGVGAMWGLASFLGVFALPIGMLFGRRFLG